MAQNYYGVLIVIALVAVLLFSGCGRKSKVNTEMEGLYIALQPFGEVPDEILEFLKGELPKHLFGIPVRRIKPLPIPKDAYDPSRGQYLSGPLLSSLQLPEGAVKVLGVVDEDLYAPGLNFIFGQASVNGVGGVIALARLRPEFWGERADDPKGLFLLRTLKEAVHELGHSFGLRHCPDPSCVMHFSNTIWDTDRKEADFCGRCRRILEARMRDIIAKYKMRNAN